MLFNAQIHRNKEISSMELLWTNPNTYPAFDPTTLNLPTGFDAFIIGFNEMSGSVGARNDTVYVYVPFSASTRYYAVRNDDVPYIYGGTRSRKVTTAIDGQVTFGSGYEQWSEDNRYCIPACIYGLHFTV